MKKKVKKRQRKYLGEKMENKGESTRFPLNNSVSLKDDYFLGFKRKGHNQLWDWNTLEDVKFN